MLALSSASGRAPFDAALRRYVDFLTADGLLDVELEIDPAIRLGPDEQIEVFRIVQEGLANSRKHSHARHAWVEIGERPDGRYVAMRDDGSGFDTGEEGGGQGLRNMRERAASIGGALTLRSAPGAGHRARSAAPHVEALNVESRREIDREDDDLREGLAVDLRGVTARRQCANGGRDSSRIARLPRTTTRWCTARSAARPSGPACR